MWHFKNLNKQKFQTKLHALFFCLTILTSCSSGGIEQSLPENDPSNTFSDDQEETWRYSLMSSTSEDISSEEISSEEFSSIPQPNNNSSMIPSTTNSDITFIQYYDEFKEVKTGDIVGPFTVSETTASYKINTEEGPDSPLFGEPGYVLSSAEIVYRGESAELTGSITILRNSEFYNVIRFIPDASSVIKIPLIAEDKNDFYIMIPSNQQGDFRSDWDGKKRVYLKLSSIHLVYGVEGARNEATLSSYRFVES